MLVMVVVMLILSMGWSLYNVRKPSLCWMDKKGIFLALRNLYSSKYIKVTLCI